MKTRTQGFTLIEAMITVAVLAILTAIALPSYNYFTKQARLREAQSKLLDAAQSMEKYYVTYKSFYQSGKTPDVAANPDDYKTQYFDITLSKTGFCQGHVSASAAAGEDPAKYCLLATPASGYGSEKRVLVLANGGSILLCDSEKTGNQCEPY